MMLFSNLLIRFHRIIGFQKKLITHAMLVSLVVLLLQACSQSTNTCFDESKNASERLLHCEEMFSQSQDIKYLAAAMELAAKNLNNKKLEALKQLGQSHKDFADAVFSAAKVIDEQYKSVWLLESADLYRTNKNNEDLFYNLIELFDYEWRRSNHNGALKYAKEALLVAKGLSSGDHQSEDSQRLEIIAFQSIFDVFQELGALAPAEEALRQIENRLGEEITGNKINAYISRGLLEMDKQNFGLASFHFDQALDAAKGSTNYSALRGLHLNITHAYTEMGDFIKAKEHLDIAWSYAEPDGSVRFALLFYQGFLELNQQQFKKAIASFEAARQDPDLPAVWLWELFYYEGLSSQSLGNIQKANTALFQSIAALEDMRNSLGYTDLKSHLFFKKRQPFELLFENLAQAGDLDRALDIAEKLRARSFVDAMVERYDGFTNESNQVNGNEFDDLVDAANRIESLGSYVDSLAVTKTKALDDLSSLYSILEEHVVLVTFLTQENLWVGRVSKNGFESLLSQLPRNDFEQLVKDYQTNPNELKTLQALGEAVFPQSLLPVEGSHIYLLFDDSLMSVNIPSLVVDSNAIVHHHPLSLIPSLNAFYQMQSKIHTAGDFINKSETIVVIGDPEKNLPSAQTEARYVASMMEGNLFLGEEAKVDVFNTTDDLSLLHIASHSGNDRLGPWLMFANGKIRSHQLLKQSLNTQLTFLASCNSAVDLSNNIWSSLAAVFLINHSNAVVGATRSIDDKITKQLVEVFYENFKQGKTVSQSLANAQKSLQSDGVSFYDWSSFVVLGDGEFKWVLH